MRNFRLVIPDKRPKLEAPKLEDMIDIEEAIEMPNPNPARAYKPFPTKEAWYSVGGKDVIPVSIYTQHRQQDSGRVIALGLDKAHRLIERQENIWTFSQYVRHHTGDEYKLYTVEWDGLGVPSGSVCTGTYSQGTNYTREDETEIVHLRGLPHRFTWAVKWIVEGVPPKSQWPPIPSRWPNYPYNEIAPWPEYPVA